MKDTEIPDVDDTDLTRDEMAEVAEACGIDHEGLDDQELLERLGVALGELDASQAADGGDEADGGGPDPTAQRAPGEPIEGPTRNELRDRLRELGLPVTGTKAELQQRLDEVGGGGLKAELARRLVSAGERLTGEAVKRKLKPR